MPGAFESKGREELVVEFVLAYHQTEGGPWTLCPRDWWLCSGVTDLDRIEQARKATGSQWHAMHHLLEIGEAYMHIAKHQDQYSGLGRQALKLFLGHFHEGPILPPEAGGTSQSIVSGLLAPDPAAYPVSAPPQAKGPPIGTHAFAESAQQPANAALGHPASSNVGNERLSAAEPSAVGQRVSPAHALAGKPLPADPEMLSKAAASDLPTQLQSAQQGASSAEGSASTGAKQLNEASSDNLGPAEAQTSSDAWMQDQSGG